MKRKQVTSNRFIGHICKRAYLYYPSACDDTFEHTCNPCDATEHARVRAVAYIHKSWSFTDPTSPVEWKAGIAAKKIIIIPETHGSYDGGTPKEGPGYGDQVSSFNGSDFTAKYFDPNYTNNIGFYNGLKRTRNWRFAFCTETQVRLPKAVCVILPKDPVTDELTGVVVWEVDVKWTEGDIASSHNIPEGIFECFIAE